jgi:hypothetical protein
MAVLRSRTARTTLAILAIGGLLLFALLSSGLPTSTANAATLTRMSPAARLVAQGRATNDTSANPQFVGALFAAVAHAVTHAATVLAEEMAENEELEEAAAAAALGLARPVSSHTSHVASAAARYAVLDQP